jgi:hypothetical protein
MRGEYQIGGTWHPECDCKRVLPCAFSTFIAIDVLFGFLVAVPSCSQEPLHFHISGQDTRGVEEAKK